LALVYTPVIAYLHNHPLLSALLTGLVGVAIGAALVVLRNIRKYRGTSQSLELNNRLADAERRYKKALASNEASHTFFANMSHELRTPFQGLLGMLDLVGNSPLDAAQREYLSTAQRAAHHLLGVLNDILDVSAMDSGMFSLSRSPMSLRQVLHDVEALMGREAQHKGLNLSVSCDNDVPPWVEGDETRVRQILFNLLSNALKFTREGRIAIRIRRSKSHTNGIVMSVQDTGSGMDEATVQQLFTRFFQADSSRQRRTGGTGLGLEISRNLARMMGGDIHVASQPGVGTTFTVLLLLSACEPAEPDDFSEPAPLQEPEANAADMPSLHFLVADDHPINLQYLLHLLHSMGHQATLCDNGKKALALAQQHSYDALLLDYHMPDMDGLEVTRAIRAGPEPFSATKILLLTADVVNDTRQLAREAGVDAFLSKPLKNRDLERAILACGLYAPQTPAGRRAHTAPQFMMSDYELPGNIDVPASDEPAGGTALVDWPALQELTQIMSQPGVEEQLQALYSPGTGALAECTTAVLQGGIAQQRAAIHKLKGSLLLLGLQAMATYCAKGEDKLKASPPQTLGRPWTTGLNTLAQKTQEELAAHFAMRSS
ncbi:MAG: ATP-binding protein, partial [Hydrogenophaga sp.]|nr:ATP-binding protein [Hydrogenophaga sp.]